MLALVTVARAQPPAGEPPAAEEAPRAPAPARKVLGSRLFTLLAARSPVGLPLASPGGMDFVVTVPLLPVPGWTSRRQGAGVSLELEDGSLYRGTVIHNGSLWVTLQGRPKGGKVRLIDGRQLSFPAAGFRDGFRLSVRREGPEMELLVNGQEMLSRPVLTTGVRSLSLTLENFDPGSARFHLGNVYYQETGETAATDPAAGP